MTDARLAPVDIEDIAKAAFALLHTSGHQGKRSEMTGPEALSMTEIGEQLSLATRLRCLAKWCLRNRGVPLIRTVDDLLALPSLDDVYHLKTVMRYSADHKQQTRERIVRAAARRFRRRGSEGAGISDLMRDLRLTHGGFYRHFDSKEGLFAEAFEHSLKEVGDRVIRAIESAALGGELKALIDAYLDIRHCDDVAGGCPVAALASEVARRPRGARGPFQQALRAHISRMARYVPAKTEEERRGKTIALFSGMAGTLAVARAFTDEQDRRRILDGARKFYLAAAER